MGQMLAHLGHQAWLCSDAGLEPRCEPLGTEGWQRASAGDNPCPIKACGMEQQEPCCGACSACSSKSGTWAQHAARAPSGACTGAVRVFSRLSPGRPSRERLELRAGPQKDLIAAAGGDAEFGAAGDRSFRIQRRAGVVMVEAAGPFMLVRARGGLEEIC